MKKRYTIGLLLICAIIIAIYADINSKTYREMKYLLQVMNPPKKSMFKYDMDPVEVQVGDVKYSVPKAYFNAEYQLKDAKDGKKISNLSIWASIKDDMAPWPVSESFKRRDSSAAIRIYILWGKTKNHNLKDYILQHTKNNIDSLRTRGGGVNRGDYKGVFTRYDGVWSKRTLKSDKSVEWHENYVRTAPMYKNYTDFPKFHRDKKNGRIIERSLSNFFLVPKQGDEKYFIRCYANSPYSNCKVRSVYLYENIGVLYEFLIPRSIVENYRQRDAKVSKLISKLIVKQEIK